MEDFIPKRKGDFEAVNKLSSKSINEIRPYVMELLEWVQDGNWPIARSIGYYFSLNLSGIENEILLILDENNRDDVWKLWIIDFIIIPNKGNIPTKIFKAIARIYFSPTIGEIEELVYEIVSDNFIFINP